MDWEKKIELLGSSLVELSKSRKFRTNASDMVERQLSSILRTRREIKQFTDDAVGKAQLQTLAAMKRKNGSQLAPFIDASRNDLHAYLLTVIRNICYQQLSDWSVLDENGKAAARPRYELDRRDALAVHELAEGHSYFHDPGLNVDIARSDRILADRGLNPEEIEILKLHYADVSYAELARTRGGSPDKYRKMVKRALSKISLEEAPDC